MARKPVQLQSEKAGHIESLINATTVMNAKGGVGKTSTVAALGGVLAAAGFKVLLVDLDPQANLNSDLGYERADGADLFQALYAGTAVPVLRGIRPNLDVVRGGRMLAAIRSVLEQDQRSLPHALYASLAPVAADYDFVLIDTSPGEQEIGTAALSISRAVIFPTGPDEASLDGVEMAAGRFAAARELNPKLEVAGVLLFNVATSARKIERKVRASLQEMLGAETHVFHRRIRHLMGAAVDARYRGVLPHELLAITENADRERLDAVRNGRSLEDAPHSSRQGVEGLVDDYDELAREFLNRMKEIQGADHGA